MQVGLKFSSLGSGSKGNGTLVQYRDSTVLIDCGFTLKETEKRLRHLGISPNQIDALLVTHEHGDHINGVGPLARRYGMPVYMTNGTRRARDIGKIPHFVAIKNYASFALKDFKIHPVAVPHDAEEPTQFVLEAGIQRLGILTDLGSITPHVESEYERCDALILEANHDVLMLAAGPYPPSLKERVGGHWGHLSNYQAAELLQRVMCSRLQHLVIAHISEQNNSLAKVKESFDFVSLPAERLIFADQQDGFDWVELQP